MDISPQLTGGLESDTAIRQRQRTSASNRSAELQMVAKRLSDRGSKTCSLKAADIQNAALVGDIREHVAQREGIAQRSSDGHSSIRYRLPISGQVQDGSAQLLFVPDLQILGTLYGSTAVEQGQAGQDR